MKTTHHRAMCACGECADKRRQSALAAAKEEAEARRSAADCSPGSELRAGYKIAFSNYGQVKRWRILKIQNGLALVTEGWGVHKLLSVTSIAVAPYMIEQTRFPWYLRPFYRENDQVLPVADTAAGSKKNDL